MHHHWGVTGPICHCSALCVVVGLSLPHNHCRWWAHLSSFSPMRHRWAILVIVGLSLDPYSLSLVGPFTTIGSHQGLLIVLGRSLGLTCFIGSHCPTLHRWVLVPSCWRHSHEQKTSVWSEARKKENHTFVTY